MPRSELDRKSRWHGAADAVLVTAASPRRTIRSSSRPSLPATAARRRCRRRRAWTCRGTPFYDKELELRLSRSYGPGRYDPDYELHGLDYPIGYVRWTEQRNMEAFLRAHGRWPREPAELITHRFPFAEAERAFACSGRRERPIACRARYRGAAADSGSGRRAPPRRAAGEPRSRRRGRASA